MISCSKKIKLFELGLKTQKNIELVALPVYIEIYIKSKIRTYNTKVYTNFHSSNVLEEGVE